MARSKQYKAASAESGSDQGMDADHDTLVIELPFSSSTNNRTIDFNRWMGKGIDEWVYASANALRGRSKGSFATATVAAIWAAGITPFFKFLTDEGISETPVSPASIESMDVDRYIAWLNRKYEKSQTKSAVFANFKLLLSALTDHGALAPREAEWIPSNPFPRREWKEEISETLTPSELKRLASALKSDLVAIHQGVFKGAASMAICVPLLILALRSGINLTPLLEMRRDCLRPHPFMPNMMLLDSVKRRGKGRQSTLMRGGSTDVAKAIQMDGVGVLKMALEMTADLSLSANENIKDRIWLFRRPKGGVSCVSANVLSDAIKSIVRRHQILGDDGTAIKVNVGIIRKTKANALWRLTDGDIAVVAAAMGHTPKVADNHYLKLDEGSKAEGARFIGEAFVDGLRRSDLTPTPTGSCKDSLSGSYAPKNGATHCSEFMHCLSCPSYAIVGSVKDLHRLFSFQQFLKQEISGFESEEWMEWRMQRQRLAEHVDKIADDNFQASVVEEARSMAKNKPHAFWAIKMRRDSNTLSGGFHG